MVGEERRCALLTMRVQEPPNPEEGANGSRAHARPDDKLAPSRRMKPKVKNEPAAPKLLLRQVAPIEAKARRNPDGRKRALA